MKSSRATPLLLLALVAVALGAHFGPKLFDPYPAWPSLKIEAERMKRDQEVAKVVTARQDQERATRDLARKVELSTPAGRARAAARAQREAVDAEVARQQRRAYGSGGALRIGMTATQVRETWGQPGHVDTLMAVDGTSEVWSYGSTSLSFREGILLAVLQHK